MVSVLKKKDKINSEEKQNDVSHYYDIWTPFSTNKDNLLEDPHIVTVNAQNTCTKCYSPYS